MYIQQVNLNAGKSNSYQAKSVNFSGTLSQATKAVREATELCDGKRSFMTGIIENFQQFAEMYLTRLQTSSKISYKFGEVNPVPEALKNPGARNVWRNLDSFLNNEGFKCSSNCDCGEGITRGELAKTLFKGMNVENPDVLILK